jgi:hypothetical protein
MTDSVDYRFADSPIRGFVIHRFVIHGFADSWIGDSRLVIGDEGFPIRDQGFCSSVFVTILTPILLSTHAPHFFGPLSREAFCDCAAFVEDDVRLTLTGAGCDVRGNDCRTMTALTGASVVVGVAIITDGSRTGG